VPKGLKFAVPGLAFVALLGFFLVGLFRDPSYIPSPFINKPAPAFDLPRLQADQQRLTLLDMRGNYSLVNVWATWCAGCRQEHDILLRIVADYNIPIYGLNWKDEPSKAKQWLQQLGDPYVANGVDTLGNTAIDWGVYGAPETFLLSPEGVVLHKHIGPLTMDIWRNDFLPLVQEQGG
jgi:cytochrome c biogenesis protein CcmG, thiol:disulfide interchange protein DsbE